MFSHGLRHGLRSYARYAGWSEAEPLQQTCF
jgi:hypothetical protein